MKRIIWAIQAAVFYLFTLLTAAIPARATRRVGSSVGRLMFHALVARRRIAIDNIRRAMPYLQQQPEWDVREAAPEDIARETFMHLGMSLVETCRLYHGKATEIIESIEIRGREHVEQARARNKGLLLLTGHCGNWELLALAYCVRFNDSMSVIARRQNNPYLNSMVERMRIHYNNRVIYKQGALKAIIGVLKKKGIIGILADQAVLMDEGVLIDVLGRKAWASKAPVVIAQKTGAALVPAFIHREAGRHVMTFYPEVTLSGDMSEEGIRQQVQLLSRYIERFIIAHPADWYWVHRRWKRAGEPV